MDAGDLPPTKVQADQVRRRREVYILGAAVLVGLILIGVAVWSTIEA